MNAGADVTSFQAVVLGSMALLGQSRGWLFALPIVYLKIYFSTVH